MEYMFRDLTENEIEVRIGSCKENGLSLLLYKSARVDMDILDETFGTLGWQRHHLRDNCNCIISLWDDVNKQWIEKEDTGTESNTEKEKGLASDSFKRAGFNCGIGRELYTSPFIWVKAEDCNITVSEFNGKKTLKCYDNFSVEKIKIVDKKIVGLSIINDKTGKRVFVYSEKKGE
jgi:hypothetical protein